MRLWQAKVRAMAGSLPRLRRILFGLCLAFALFCLLLIWWLIPPVWQLREGPIEVLRWPRSGEKVFQVGPNQANWVDIEQVSHHVINAIIVAEDARFHQHRGLDYVEIRNSIRVNLERRAYVRGASTISQQVVKMAFLSQEKTLMRKLREALGTVVMEAVLDKDSILEWYINLIEFGDGVFGIKAAAEHYFDTEAELLTIQHGANLALVLPSPNNWSAGLRSRELTDFGHRRYAQIIEEMFRQGYITRTLRDRALATGDFGRPIRRGDSSRGRPPVGDSYPLEDGELVIEDEEASSPAQAEEGEGYDLDSSPEGDEPSPEVRLDESADIPPHRDEALPHEKN